jgi:hypothetical protein
MEIDIFPVLGSNEPLTRAFDVMTASSRSGVVVESHDSYSLIEAVDVVVGIAEQGSHAVLGQVQNGVPLPLLQPSDLGLTTFDFRLGSTHHALEQYLDGQKTSLALLVVTGWRALVASRNEYKMPEQAAPKDCFCKTDRKPVSPGVDKGDCPHDTRHLGSVRCR